MWKKLAIGVLVLNLLALDGYVVYNLAVVPSRNVELSKNIPAPTDTIKETIVKEDACGESCQDYIDLKLGLLATITASVTPIISKVPASTNTKKRVVQYIPIPGSGSVLSTEWTSISSTDFYLDTSDYPGLVESYLEVNMKLVNGNGSGFVRLFDSSHGIAVQGSEVKTSSQSSVAIVSGKISLWAGKNLYKIQAKSLTADTTVFEGGRLKLITEY